MTIELRIGEVARAMAAVGSAREALVQAQKALWLREQELDLARRRLWESELAAVPEPQDDCETNQLQQPAAAAPPAAPAAPAAAFPVPPPAWPSHEVVHHGAARFSAREPTRMGLAPTRAPARNRFESETLDQEAE